jgi:uncharacterized membrane protein
MGKNRLEMFSDGVIAIIITIMVLELRGPHEFSFEALQPLGPKLLSYVLSFVTIGIFWSHHHHLLHAVHHVNRAVLWANLHFLFWLSLIPSVTAWMGEHQFHRVPVAVYGAVVLMVGVSYRLLEQVLVKFHDKESMLARSGGPEPEGLVLVCGLRGSDPAGLCGRVAHDGHLFRGGCAVAAAGQAA